MISIAQPESGEQFRPLVSQPTHLMFKVSSCWLCVIHHALSVVNSFCIQPSCYFLKNIFLLGLLQCNIPILQIMLCFPLYTGCIMSDCRRGLEVNIKFLERKWQL